MPMALSGDGLVINEPRCGNIGEGFRLRLRELITRQSENHKDHQPGEPESDKGLAKLAVAHPSCLRTGCGKVKCRMPWMQAKVTGNKCQPFRSNGTSNEVCIRAESP